jgi:rhodanese-related sulfurtransferase
LGAQAVGLDGVDKRIDAFPIALQLGATVYDLEEAELTCAPQLGSAKSLLNFTGMVAADVLQGDLPVAHWDDERPFLLDVRQPAELAIEQVPGRPHDDHRPTIAPAADWTSPGPTSGTLSRRRCDVSGGPRRPPDAGAALAVALAQSAEHWIVAPEVTGSSPVGHPTTSATETDVVHPG